MNRKVLKSPLTISTLCKLTGSLIILFTMSGCASSYFHNSENMELAKQAHTSFKSAKLSEGLEGERKVLKSIESRENQVIRRHELALRDRVLTALINGKTKETSWNKLESRINSRISELANSSYDDLTIAYKYSKDELKIANDEVDRLKAEYFTIAKGKNLPALKPDMSEEDKDKIKSVIRLSPLLNSYIRHVDQIRKLENKLEEAIKKDSEIEKIRSQVTRIKKHVVDLEDSAKKIKAEYTELKKNYNSSRSEKETPKQLEEQTNIYIAARTWMDSSENEDDAWKSLEKSIADATVDGSKKTGEAIKKLAEKIQDNTEDQEAKDELKDVIEKGLKEAAVGGNPTALVVSIQDLMENLDDLSEKRDTITNTAEDLGLKNLNLSAQIVKLEIIKDSVDEIASGFIDTGGAAPDASDKETSIQYKVALSVKEIYSLFSNIKGYPGLVHLLLESEQLRLDLENLKKEKFFQEKLIAILDKRLDYKDTELVYLLESSASIRELRKNVLSMDDDADWHGSISDYFTGENSVNGKKNPLYPSEKLPAVREEISRILYYYANSWTLGRAEHEVAEYQEIALSYETSLEKSAIALQKWENLIGVPLAQLLAFHSSGIKPEDLANLINAAGLGAIAWGVN